MMQPPIASKLIASFLAVALTFAVFGSKLAAQELPAEVHQALPAATQSGTARLRIWGFEIYDSRLWVAPGFSASTYTRHPLALELAYLRDFKGSAIAERSIAEMRRFGSFTDEQASRWQAAMTALYPDVKKGDRLMGIYRPGAPLRYVYNGKPLGEIADPEFAELFIGIWLSPKTSEPKMRQALLDKAAP